jgi:NTP pyrophosphatase (non-canonical NTP hydrolase)
MTLNEYQEKAWLTAKYPNIYNNLIYPTLGLAGEAGEIANKVKKIQRDDNGILTLNRREQLIEEIGDALWYIAAMATEIGTSIEAIAIRNVEKLEGRLHNNSINGEGDER